MKGSKNALVLEGGGARGAYHMGALEALTEMGYDFGGVFGTSIGSLNAAMVAQNDVPECEKLWREINTSMLFDIDENEIEKLIAGNYDKAFLTTAYASLKRAVGDRGIDTARIHELLSARINEQKIRDNAMDFGFVTYNLSQKKGREVFIEDVPEGMLVNYLVASSNFPGLRPEVIDGDSYLDGAFYDNLPINMAIQKGYTSIFAIRTLAVGMTRKPTSKAANVTYITPSEPLGKLMVFSHEQIMRSRSVGYYDAMRVLKNLAGVMYYIEPPKDGIGFEILNNISAEKIKELGDLLSLGLCDKKRMLFEKIVPLVANNLKLSKNYSYLDFVIAIVEQAAAMQNVDRLRIVTLRELIASVNTIEAPKPKVLFKLGQIEVVGVAEKNLNRVHDIMLDAVLEAFKALSCGASVL